MKTKKEIEQLAVKYADGYNMEEAHASYIAFQDGYAQCQEDMADEIAELKMLCKEYSKDIKALNNIINSLKKQD